MRAFELSGVGLSELRMVDRPDPEPGPRQVCVRIAYASLNFRDLVVINGGYGRNMPDTLIPLSDGAGEVMAVGEGVTDLAAGDRVMTHFFQRWHSGAPTLPMLLSSLGGPHDGVLRERAVFDRDGVIHVPDHLELREAAALPCAGVTAWNALRELSSVGPGDTVLIQGTGGVSLFAVQFAKLLGARVIVTSSSDQKLERARALGADMTINYRDTPKWGEQARALSDGGVDHVIEVGGAGTIEQSLRATVPGATISLIGMLAGPKHEVNLPHVFMPQKRLQGVVVGSQECARRMLRAIQAHRLHPVIDEHEFDFDSAKDALGFMAEGRHFGKIVVRIGGD